MSTLRNISIEVIRHRPDARHRSDEALAALCESIQENRLINPITVRPLGDGYEVVAGSHRLQACELLGHCEIVCIVMEADDLHAELSMIDENLIRSELSPADRAKQIARRKAIYAVLHPETVAGISQAAGMNATRERGGQAGHDVDRFDVATAKITGQSDRSVRRAAERGEKIVPEALNEVRGTQLDHGTYLDGLKRVEPVQQVATVRRDLERPRQGGIAAQYARVETPAPPDNAKLFARFISIADEIEEMSVAGLIDGAGRQRAVLGQRASGLADRMGAIMEGLDQ